MDIGTWSDTNDETTNISPTPNRSSNEPEQTIEHSLPSPSQFSGSAQELAANLDAPQVHGVLTDESILARYERDEKIRSLLGEGSETAYFYDEGDTIFTKLLGSSAVYGYDGSSLNKISEDFYTLIKAGDYYVVETFGTPEQRNFFVLDNQGSLVQQIPGPLSYNEDHAYYTITHAADNRRSFYDDSLAPLIEDMPEYSSLYAYDDKSVLLTKKTSDENRAMYAVPRGTRSDKIDSLRPLTTDKVEQHNLYQSFLINSKKSSDHGSELQNRESPYSIDIDAQTGVVRTIGVSDDTVLLDDCKNDRILDEYDRYLSPINEQTKKKLHNGILGLYDKNDHSHILLLNLHTGKTTEIKKSIEHFINGKSIQNFVNKNDADIYDASFTKLGRQVAKEKYEPRRLPYTEYITDSGKHQVIVKRTGEVSPLFDRIITRYTSHKDELYPYSGRTYDYDKVILIVENDGKVEAIVLPT